MTGSGETSGCTDISEEPVPIRLSPAQKARIAFIESMEDIVWGRMVFDKEDLPSLCAITCFACCPCTVRTTAGDFIFHGVPSGKVAWLKFWSFSTLFTIIQAIILIVTCVIPPGLAPFEVRAFVSIL